MCLSKAKLERTTLSYYITLPSLQKMVKVHGTFYLALSIIQNSKNLY